MRFNFRVGENLFSEREASDAAYVLISGSTNGLIASPDGTIVTSRLGANAIIVEMGIVAGNLRSATISRLRWDLNKVNISARQNPLLAIICAVLKSADDAHCGAFIAEISHVRRCILIPGSLRERSRGRQSAAPADG